MIQNRKIKFSLFVFLSVCLPALFLLATFGCSQKTIKPGLGRCAVNADCPIGERCIRGFCEDIYYPKR